MVSRPAQMAESDACERVLASRDLAHTVAIGQALSGVLAPGDLVTVSGPLGAGKSELCRATVRALMGQPMLDVPSPSYTLVNVYDGPECEIWHADLYRIGDASELVEIGLEDAVPASIVLVEWPERWPDLPPRRLEITIDPTSGGNHGGDRRDLQVRTHGAWRGVLETLEQTA